jgi:hypothetical protein
MDGVAASAPLPAAASRWSSNAAAERARAAAIAFQRNKKIGHHVGEGVGSEHGKVLCGALKSFCRMQNLVKASTSLNSAHPEQLIATSFGANGPPWYQEEQSHHEI